MKLEDVKSKIDTYFKNIDAEELYRRSVEIYNFIEEDLIKNEESDSVKKE